MDGWIKLHRKIEKHWIWENPVFIKAWLYCLVRANYEENKVLIGVKIEMAEPGSFFTSIGKFSRATGLSIKQTRLFWELLEKDKMVLKNATSKRTKITVCNYVNYQVLGQTKDKRKTNEGQTKGNGEEGEEGKKERLNTLSDPPGSDSKSKKEDSGIFKETEKCLPLSRTLARIVQSQKNIDVTATTKKSWANEIRKLIFTSEKVSYERVETALSWYRKNVGGEYVPVIESGASLRKKFTKLEDAIARDSSGPKNGTVRGGAKTPKDGFTQFESKKIKV